MTCEGIYVSGIDGCMMTNPNRIFLSVHVLYRKKSFFFFFLAVLQEDGWFFWLWCTAESIMALSLFNGPIHKFLCFCQCFCVCLEYWNSLAARIYICPLCHSYRGQQSPTVTQRYTAAALDGFYDHTEELASCNRINSLQETVTCF